MQAKLRVGSDPYLIGCIADFTFKWSLNAGMTQECASRLTMAVNELATDIVLFAYPDEEGEFEVIFNQEPNYLEVIITESGVPFEPENHKYNITNALTKHDFDGAGFKIIEGMVDDFTFLNHGKKGKEFRLIKYLPSGGIADLELEENDISDEERSFDYKLRRAVPEDSEKISRLFYQVYKNTYTKDLMYYPKLVERAIKHHDRFGVLVEHPKDGVVGFFAILRTTDSQVGEIGEAAVHKLHRQKGLMSKMITELIEIANEKNLLGIFGEAVTVHPVSQKVNYKYDMHSCAILLGMFPNALYKGLNEQNTQNISVVIDFRLLQHQPLRYYYLPKTYRRIIKQIFKNLGVEVFNLRSHTHAIMAESTETQLKIDYDGNNALMVVEKYGKDFETVVKTVESDMQQRGISVFMIDLPLDLRITKHAPEILKRTGYVFAGVMPLFHLERDFLRMQKVFCEIDLNQVYTFSKMAKLIKRTIKKEFDELHTERKEILS